MSDKDPAPLKPNRPKLALHVPEPPFRPGDKPDFSKLKVPAAGSAPRPDVSAAASETHPLTTALVRVLGEDNRAVGPWDPKLDPDTLRKMLRDMVTVRVFDDRMYRAQRQGKTSFYMKCTGEEAIAVAAGNALDRDDMCFPTYRQQGLLVARGYPLVDMMNQIYSNKGDKLKGRQLPIMYSDKRLRLLLDLGQSRHAIPAGGRLGDGLGDQGRQPHRHGLDRRRSDGGRRLPLRADLRRGLQRARRSSTTVNNQWAISSFSGIAGAERATFARARVGYGIAGLRVDGNDALAVYAAVRWAAERARTNQGPTLIELFTYRAEGHSTSDDPSGYRPADEAQALAARRSDRAAEGASRSRSANGTRSGTRRWTARCDAAVRAAQKEAEKLGILPQQGKDNHRQHVRGRVRGDALAPRGAGASRRLRARIG